MSLVTTLKRLHKVRYTPEIWDKWKPDHEAVGRGNSDLIGERW